MIFSDNFKAGMSAVDALKANEAGRGSIKDNMDDLCDILENEILKSKSSDEEKKTMLKKLRRFCETETNIMLVGATGCGKSSTINALFATNQQTENKHTDYTDDGELEENTKDSLNLNERFVEVAKVGSRTDPETKDVERYKIGKLVLWDTPGLGDGTEIDEHHKTVIKDLLEEKDEKGNQLIDIVLLILDGSSRDLGTSYTILNEVIIPNMGEETNRILVALNQADIAMKTGRHWNYEKNEPDEILLDFLNEKVCSIKERLKVDSKVEVDPIFYCAGYKEENGDVVYPYNLSKLLYYILKSLPAEKRVAVMESVNMDQDNYVHNDLNEDYNSEVKEEFYESFDYITEGVDKGADIGYLVLGLPGAVVGAFLGGFVGCVRDIIDEIF